MCMHNFIIDTIHKSVLMRYTARIYIPVVTLKWLNLTGTSPGMLPDFFQML